MPNRTRRPRKRSESIVPKDRLAAEMARIIDHEGLTQTETAWAIKDSPSQVSLVVRGKLRGISVDRLARMLTLLGRDVDLVIRPTAGGRGGKVRVDAR